MEINNKLSKKVERTIDPTQSEEISINGLIETVSILLKYLISKWLFLLLFSIIGGLAGFCFALYSKPVYTASSTFVLEESGSSSSLSQYAGLASMVGIDLGGGGSGIFQGDNLLELYRSRTMIEKTLLSEVEINGKRDLLINRFISINNLRKKWADDPKLMRFIFTKELIGTHTRIQDSIVGTVVTEINKKYLTVSKPDKKLNIIQVIVKANDELFAKLFNDQIVKNVNDFYVQTKTKKAQDNLDILQHQTDSVKRELNGAISGIAMSLDANPNVNPARQILKVPSQKRQVDVQANTAILEELVKNLEISKMSYRKDAPLIQLIDTPVFPLMREQLGKIKGLIIGIILGGGLSAVFFLVKYLFKKMSNSN